MSKTWGTCFQDDHALLQDRLPLNIGNRVIFRFYDSIICNALLKNTISEFNLQSLFLIRNLQWWSLLCSIAVLNGEYIMLSRIWCAHLRTCLASYIDSEFVLTRFFIIPFDSSSACLFLATHIYLFFVFWYLGRCSWDMNGYITHHEIWYQRPFKCVILRCSCLLCSDCSFNFYGK